jgi:hypothetical protein
MPNDTNSNQAVNDFSGCDGPIEWSVHPSAHQPVKSALTVMVIAMTAGALYRATGVVLYSLIAVLVLGITLAPFFLHTCYRLDENGVTVTRVGRSRTLEWRSVRTVTAKNNTIYVSPHTENSLREWHGVLLLCPGNAERVRRYIRCHTGKNSD